jgi:hypothetical protein
MGQPSVWRMNGTIALGDALRWWAGSGSDGWKVLSR